MRKFWAQIREVANIVVGWRHCCMCGRITTPKDLYPGLDNFPGYQFCCYECFEELVLSSSKEMQAIKS